MRLLVLGAALCVVRERSCSYPVNAYNCKHMQTGLNTYHTQVGRFDSCQGAKKRIHFLLQNVSRVCVQATNPGLRHIFIA